MSYRKFKRNIAPEYLRLKDAMAMFSMGADKIEALAKECGAYFKVDRVVLIHTDTMREYIEVTIRRLNKNILQDNRGKK